MAIDDKTRSVLIGKLHFTDEQIERLENCEPLQTKMLSLLHLARQSPKEPEIRRSIIVQLKKIRRSLSQAPQDQKQVLQEARSEFYTFHRAAR